MSCFASIASPSFGGSYAAPVSLVGAIMVACAHTQTARSLEILKQSEQEDRNGRRWHSAIGQSDVSE
jgi:hypothetical protein